MLDISHEDERSPGRLEVQCVVSPNEIEGA